MAGVIAGIRALLATFEPRLVKVKLMFVAPALPFPIVTSTN